MRLSRLGRAIGHPDRIVRRLHGIYVARAREREVLKLAWPSTWSRARPVPETQPAARGYLVAHPHPHAQLGHQVSNWIAGYMISSELNLTFVPPVLTSDPHNKLGLATCDPAVRSAAASARKVHLPPAGDERDLRGHRRLEEVVRTKLTGGRDTQFHLTLDQPWWDQTLVGGKLRELYWTSENAMRFGASRRSDDSRLRVGVHLRRGDLIRPGEQGSDRHEERWLDVDYYASLLTRLRDSLEGRSDLSVDVYTTSASADLGHWSNLPFELAVHSDRDRDLDLHEMITSDILVCAPSSFSFTAGLISTSPVLMRWPWWHNVPDKDRFFRCDAAGRFDAKRLRREIDTDRGPSGGGPA